MFYLFDQNNTGGDFDIGSSVAQFVIIEAENADAANEIAEDLGIYFNGVDEASDCPCCGDRWYPVYESDASTAPMICGQKPRDFRPILTALGEVYCLVHYQDGIVEEHRYQERVQARLTT